MQQARNLCNLVLFCERFELKNVQDDKLSFFKNILTVNMSLWSGISAAIGQEPADCSALQTMHFFRVGAAIEKFDAFTA